jgi:ArsR family transcriptional regulator
MTKQSLRHSVDGLKALAHPVRLRMLALLREGELCVCQVTEILGLAPSTISEHLSLLRRAGVITERKEGKWVFYALADDPALGPLCEALWPLVAGDTTLKADARHCTKVRKMPLSSLYKGVGGSQRPELTATDIQSSSDVTSPPPATQSGAAR